MKIKRIILTMLSALILVAVFAQNVFAVENIELTLMELNANSANVNDDNPEFGLNSTDLGITQIANSNGERRPNAYCAMAGVGFENRTNYSETNNKYQDIYKTKYNMSTEKQTIQNEGMYLENYDEILALADLFYLGSSDTEFEAYIKPLFDKQYTYNGKHYYVLHEAEEYTYEQLKQFKPGRIITPNQVRAVQQVALWYFTNPDRKYLNVDDDSDTSENNSKAAFLYYRTHADYQQNQNSYKSLSTGTGTDGDYQNNMAKQLYKYLIRQAKTNAKNVTNGNYESTNTVYLYTNGTIAKKTTETTKSQPVIEIEPGKKEFDLALRKYITKVGNTNINDRNPNIVTTKLDNGESTTAEYKHKKDPVTVNEGDEVIYTLTVYNEGDVNGRATQIVDQLPTGLEFDQSATVNLHGDNDNYTFNYDSANNKVTISEKQALNNLNKYNNDGTLDKTSVQVVCTVTAHANTDTDKILTNVAWISEAYNDSTGEKYTGTEKGPDTKYDRDSAPGTTPQVNKDSMESYKGKETNQEVTPADSDYYYEGQEDDDDFEKLVLKPKKMDLALRKFITKIGDKNIEDRMPQIGGSAVEGETTTAEKKHPKNKVSVSRGDTVVYTIRVYNEGQIDGYAKEVTDYLPEGLDLKEESTINSQYGWTSDGKTITTRYLADTIIKAANRDYTKLNEEEYYKDLLVECVVNNKATSNNLKNIAAITEAEDKSGNKVDEDSQPEDIDTDKYSPKKPEEGLGEQDDDDFEDLQVFDLALRKYITKVEDEQGEGVELPNLSRTPDIDESTIESETTTATYDHRKDPVVVKPGYFVYYSLTVYNEGGIDGYAKTITDTLPSGLKFIAIDDEDNSKYKLDSYTESTNTLILTRKDNQGTITAYDGNTLNSETVTIKCQVTANAKEGGDKIYTNIAWISEDYNESGVTDIDSKPSEHPQEEDLVTDSPSKGYIGEGNDDKDWTNPDEYFEGQQDDDDFEKIIIYDEPEIHKGVKEVENQDSGYDDDVNKPHEWVINSSLPSNIANYKKYEIVDDIDYRLVYEGIISVNIIDKKGTKVAELTENTDYKVTYTQNTEQPDAISDILGNKYSGTLKLTFISEEQIISDKIKENGGNIIEVKFKTTFAKDKDGKLLAEIIGKEIPNKARLDYTNESGENHKESEIPEVHTGGITLYKYKKSNGEKVALKDAEFAIYRTREDAENKTNAVQTAKSGENGLVEFVGLEYGEDAKDNESNKKTDGTYIQGEANARVIPGTKYWIVETKAPEGYATIKEPIEVTINNGTYKEDVEVLIKEEESKETTNRLIENKPLNFDLALRKFITKVEDKDVTTRVPQVKYADGKITYEHTKEPVNVVNGNVVTYTLRIFNEGQIDGYASVITDDIPDGVEFLPEHDTNKEYRWVMYTELKEGTEVEDESKVIECKVNGSSEVKKYIETEDASKAVIIRTDYLSKEQGEERKTSEEEENPNLLKTFDESKEISDTNPDYKDIKVAFRVTEPNGSKRILINYAQISDDTDENGDEVEDIDSKPDEWNEGEDDQDIEKIRVPEFDLALRKWVTEAIVIEDGKTKVTKTGHDAWDDPEDVVKVELHRKKLSKVTVKFRYSIRVYNQGEIAGYAKEVTDYIPKGLKFVAKDNPDWKDEGNNVISTRKLENTLLQPGEYADVEVLLTWINGSNNLGLKTNTAEISEDYNEWGVPDKDSTPDNKKPGEDDIDDAPVMLSVATGIEATYIMLGTSILAIIAGGIFLIKKYVL